jgi:adenylate cyclase
LWAERYDRDLTDIFAVQDDVTLQIVSALRVTLSPAEKARVVDYGTSNVAAHDAFLQGRELILASKKDRASYERALMSFNKAIALDPDYGAPYAGIAMAHNVDYHNHLTDDCNDALNIAAGFAEEAIGRDPNDPFALFVATMVATFRGKFEDAASWADAALALSPSYAPAHMARGTVDVYAGNPLSAIPQLELAIRLDPVRNQQYLHFVGTAYLTAGRYEAAAAVFKERIRVAPGSDLSRAFMASVLGHLGQFDEARQAWREMLTINPKYSFDEHVGRLPFKNQADVDRIRDGLTKAGLV